MDEPTKPVTLSEEQLDEIAKRAYERATAHIYLEIGKAAVRAALYLCGAGLLALTAWLGIDWTKLKH